MAAGCDKAGDGDGDGDGDGLDLEGRTYHAQSATDDGEAHAIVDGTTLTLRFQENDRLGASAGCNSFDGRYAIDDGRLEVTNGGWTEIGCEPDLHDQETWYFDFLQSSPALAQDGDNLTLTGDVTEIEYLDKEVATPDRDLVGPVWTVDTLIDGDAASNADWSELATFQFGEDGQVEVTTGCNTGGGGYTVEDDAITFDEVAVTEEGCPDELQQELEEGVLLVLNHAGAVTVEIDADRMWLEIPGAGLGLTAD
jgi:heat shock protein HslJ